MECYCFLRDDQDLLADGKSQKERRFGESFWDMLCSRCEFLEEEILIAEMEELEKLDASEIYPRRLNVKEVLITRDWRKAQTSEATTNSIMLIFQGKYGILYSITTLRTNSFL